MSAFKLGRHCQSSTNEEEIDLSESSTQYTYSLSATDSEFLVQGTRNSPSVNSGAVESGHVYLVATPLGNLNDITFRAKEILTYVDYICAEDTRNTINLLRHLSIPHKRMISHHEHNLKESVPYITRMVTEGYSVAVVSDAGSPGISDPGAELCSALAEQNCVIHPVPGPSAVIAALSISGFYSSEFTFMGFLPPKGSEKKRKLDAIGSSMHTVVLFEAPHRIKALFRLLQAIDGNRRVVCCRELTKKFEEARRGTVNEVLGWLETFADASEKGASNRIKGEFTVVLGPVTDRPSRQMRKTELRSLLDRRGAAQPWADAGINGFVSDNSTGEDESLEDSDDKYTLEECSTEDIYTRIVSNLELLKAAGVRRSEAVKETMITVRAECCSSVDSAIITKSLVYAMALKIQPWDIDNDDDGDDGVSCSTNGRRNKKKRGGTAK